MLTLSTIATITASHDGTADKWAFEPGLNAVPSTSVGVLSGTTSSLKACQSSCIANGSACTIFTWNLKSGHCFWRFDGVWDPANDSSRVESGCIFAPPSRAIKDCPHSPSPSPSPSPPPPPVPGTNASLPLLFLDLLDVEAPRGRIKPVASSVSLLADLSPPPLNYSGGATIFAAFNVGDAFEVFAAVGRPGEPIDPAAPANGIDAAAAPPNSADMHSTDTLAPAPSPPQGVSVLRFTSTDLRSYSKPLEVLYLPSH